MKTAIYIEDGVVQLVLTPESEFEKNAVGSFKQKDIEVKIFDGAFYDCRGGWTRQTEYTNFSPYGSARDRDNSLIIRVKTSQE